MKFIPLIWGALWRKPTRTTLTILCLVVAFTLFGLMEGIGAGLNAIVTSSRPDGLWVRPRYGIPLPIAYKQQLAQLPGVKSVTAVANVGGPIGGDQKRTVGVQFAQEGFFDFFRWLDTTPAQVAALRSNRAGIIVGKGTADRLGLKVGDNFSIRSMPRKDGGNDWPLEVVSIANRTDIPDAPIVVVGNYEYVNEARVGGADTANSFMILMNDSTLSTTTAAAIDEMFLNSPAPVRATVDREEREQSNDDNDAPEYVFWTVVSTLFALLFMTSNSMMQSFRERVPELGTLKAIGFTNGHVLSFVLAEAMIQCVMGAVIGFGVARALVPYTKAFIQGPAAWMTVSWSVFGLALLVACLVGIVSAAVPAWRAGKMEIVDALAGR